MEPRRFDLLGPLPAPATTTVLEASAGTGKTFALAGLVTRYIAEGAATLDQMLLITGRKRHRRKGAFGELENRPLVRNRLVANDHVHPAALASLKPKYGFCIQTY